MAALISFFLLAVGIRMATTSEYSGLISSLYKKAADENRPLVLVLDSSFKDAAKPSQASNPRAKTDRNYKSIQLLDMLSKKLQQKIEPKPRQEFDFDHPITDHSHRDLHRLQERLEQDIRERKERRLRKKAEKLANPAQFRVDASNKNDDGYRVTKSLVNNRLDDYKSFQSTYKQKDQVKDEKRALRSSVIKSLLRTYNDLNCDAKDECRDEKSQDECENDYKNFDCDDQRDEGCNEGNETCEDEDDKNISTRGIVLLRRRK